MTLVPDTQVVNPSSQFRVLSSQTMLESSLQPSNQLASKPADMTARHKAYYPTWVSVLCLGALLLATTAQAAHFCRLRIVTPHSGSQINSASADSRLCLTCLMAQSATVTAVVAALFPGLHGSALALPAGIQSRRLLVSFDLYVRPPPA